MNIVYCCVKHIYLFSMTKIATWTSIIRKNGKWNTGKYYLLWVTDLTPFCCPCQYFITRLLFFFVLSSLFNTGTISSFKRPQIEFINSVSSFRIWTNPWIYHLSLEWATIRSVWCWELPVLSFSVISVISCFVNLLRYA